MTRADDLKSSGLKATGPRLKILEVFQHAHLRHMTAEDVYKVLLAEDADIGLATVYRVLLQFEQAGLLKRSHFDSGKSVFELNEGQHHDHLLCLNCGRVEEFYDAEIEKPASTRWPRSAALRCRSMRCRSTRSARSPTAPTSADACQPSAGPSIACWWRRTNSP